MTDAAAEPLLGTTRAADDYGDGDGDGDGGTVIRIVGARLDGDDRVDRHDRLDGHPVHGAHSGVGDPAFAAVIRSVAHDFNNIMTAIIGYADLVLMSGPTSHIHQDVAQIRTAAQHGARLTAELMDFSRTGVIRPLPASVDSAVAEIVPLLQRLAGSGTQIQLMQQCRDAWSPMPDAQLQQVILALALMTGDATGPGGTITVEASERRLSALERARMSFESGQVIQISIRASADESPSLSTATQEPRVGARRATRQPPLDDALAMGELVRAAGGRLRLGGSSGSPEFVILLPRVDQPAIRPLGWQASTEAV